MKKIHIGIAAAVVVLATPVLVHPARAVKPAPLKASFLAASGIAPPVADILERSCANCHSGETQRPWYGYIPPASWLIERDVKEARASMDFSHWRQYDDQRRMALLALMSAAVRNHQMPPSRYTLMHPGAKLSPAEIAVLSRWTKEERRRK